MIVVVVDFVIRESFIDTDDDNDDFTKGDDDDDVVVRCGLQRGSTGGDRTKASTNFAATGRW
jgi:hypothetical protein